MDRPRCELLASKLIATYRVQGVSARSLADALQAMDLQGVIDGDFLYREGDRAEDLHVLLDGAVRVLVGPDNHELVTLKAPALLGHLGVLSGLPRSASVVAVGHVQVARLGYRDLWDVLRGRSQPGVALRRLLLAGLAQLVGQTNARLAQLVPEHGEPLPKDAPRAAASKARRPPRRGEVADALTAGFDPDLLEQVDNIRIVHTDADERHKYKG